jgi:preprotein translocase subunit SecG
MTYLLITLHVVVCIALIIIVLLQAGKGAEIGASFGAGASNTVFGASGGKSFMSRMTAAVAIVFMLTSLVLAYFWGKPGSSSVMPEAVAPVSAPAPAAPPATALPQTEKAPAAAPGQAQKK